MRRIIATCLVVFVSTVLLHAQSLQKKLQLNLSTGYQQEDLKWSIAGNLDGQSPNILSELQWKKVGGTNITAALQWNIWGRWILMGDYSRVIIKLGGVTDNDYNKDNRTDPAYGQTFNANRGFTRDVHFGAGYKLINTERLSLIPYAGYSASKQSLHLQYLTGQYADLNSTYETDWKGPFLKTISVIKLVNKLQLAASLTYTQADYKANADWNLIPSFQHPVSYRHTAKGYGVDANASLAYQINKHVAVNLGAGYFSWQTGEGIDELFLSSGGSEKTQLNGVDRKGYKILGGLILSY